MSLDNDFKQDYYELLGKKNKSLLIQFRVDENLKNEINIAAEKYGLNTSAYLILLFKKFGDKI